MLLDEDTYPLSPVLDLRKGYLYWADDGGIFRSRLDGSEMIVLVPEIGEQRGLSIDFESGKLYWTTRFEGTIRTGNIDGTEVENFLENTPAWSLALDLVNRKIYWGEATNGIQCDCIMRRANLDGTEIEDFITTDVAGVTSILVDPVNDTLYWAGPLFGLSVISLDGGNRDSIRAVRGPASGLALNPFLQQLYISPDSWPLARLELSNSELVFFPFPFDAGSFDGGIALDLRIAGDCDGDRAVTTADVKAFMANIDGADGYSWGGECPEADDDGDLDLIDVARFQRDFVGAKQGKP